ncbi:hypothetical protein SDC9_167161 [bioreactor metagenome]|uniref:Uncharacterized protein n=1 Tax=bioreactor metagenome TaxID=1076179 RepID=A0A645G1W5_9ZZZZ
MLSALRMQGMPRKRDAWTTVAAEGGGRPLPLRAAQEGRQGRGCKRSEQQPQASRAAEARGGLW